jgi:sugar/nucleoside kinase (ribokinase family)
MLDAPAWIGVEVVIVDSFSGGAGRSVAAEARRRDLPVVWIDPEPRYSHLATIAVWSSAERTPEEAERSDAFTTLLTAGSGPIEVWSGGGRLSVRPPDVTAIDATGAGDVVAAGCTYGIVRGWSTERTVTWAAAAGAAMAACGRDGELPTIADVEALLV